MKKRHIYLPSFIVLFVVLAGTIFFTFTHNVYADDPCKNISDLDDRAACYEEQIDKNEEKYESTSKKLSDIRNQKESVTGKINSLLSSLNVTQAELNAIQAEINSMNTSLEEIKKTLIEKNGQLEEKLSFRNRVIRTYSKRSFISELELFFGSPAVGDEDLSGFQHSTLTYMYGKSFNREAMRLIGVLNSEIDAYEADKKEAEALKKELEGTQAELIAAKIKIESEKNLVQGDLNVLAEKEGAYEGELKEISNRISEYSSKQQEILNLKSGGENGSVGDYQAPKWSTPKPGFSPAFAAFSYGAYTHYWGMSQYGAEGRAQAGKSYKDIIKFYYNASVKEKDDFPSKVCVDGYGEMDFQKYLYGLAEMPSDWEKEALKAQAVAGRSYAYKYVKAGKCICTSQSCQVFLKSKADNPPSRWKEAVDATKREIIDKDTGSKGYGMYSSTTGGYINDVGWDVDGKWPGGAYEKKADSPWFYWAWYSKTYRFDSDTCGRKHPWLNSEEMADILNAAVVLSKKNDSRISPTTTSCWGGDPYSISELREKAEEVGTGYKKVTKVRVDIGSNGITSKVTFETDRGTVSIGGDALKSAFNLRAPGYISIRSRLYDFQNE